MEYLSFVIIALLVLLIVLVIVLLGKSKSNSSNGIDLLDQKLDINSKQTNESINRLEDKMNGLTEKTYDQMLKINESINENAEKETKRVSESITLMQESNEKKLEEMRKTVDEKLTETLNQRLNASFRTVSEQLQNVYKSLGEMKELSTGVTNNINDLNRVLTNVKSRGTWAEVQLGNILDEIIPGMYDINVKTNPSYNGQVEFAVRIPNADNEETVYLPIDSKFPMEDYVRMSIASENGDFVELENARKALEQRVKDEGKLVKKYISTPETTPFAILYLATEGLYAEIASSKNCIVEKLQSEGVMVAGPSTITALLNSLSMGFRTVAINKKANEVWKVLGAAKQQYDKFEQLLQKAKSKINEAGRVLDDAEFRNVQIQKKLRSVESLDTDESNDVFGLEE